VAGGIGTAGKVGPKEMAERYQAVQRSQPPVPTNRRVGLKIWPYLLIRVELLRPARTGDGERSPTPAIARQLQGMNLNALGRTLVVRWHRRANRKTAPRLLVRVTCYLEQKE